jgi:hypothetical protein
MTTRQNILKLALDKSRKKGKEEGAQNNLLK